GLSVMLVLVAAAWPFTYSVPVVPDRVTARCSHWLIGTPAVAVSCCSRPEPPFVIANRGSVPVTPALGVRNMYVVVSLPQSNALIQSSVEAGLTQPAIEKSVSPPSVPAGSSTNCAGLDPLSCRPLPNIPATRPIAGGGGGGGAWVGFVSLSVIAAWTVA